MIPERTVMNSLLGGTSNVFSLFLKFTLERASKKDA